MFAGIPKRRCFERGLSGCLPDMSSSCGGKIPRKHGVAPERLSTDAGYNKRWKCEQPVYELQDEPSVEDSDGPH